jgi:multicomponent Na+:H+ antiporter subunit F
MTEDPLLLYAIFPLLGISMLLIMIRFFIGPRIADRVISLDLVISVGIGTAAAYTVMSGKQVVLDIAMIMALLAFLGTVAFAFYLERRGRKQ